MTTVIVPQGCLEHPTFDSVVYEHCSSHDKNHCKGINNALLLHKTLI